jgi:hypothetical protein
MALGLLPRSTRHLRRHEPVDAARDLETGLTGTAPVTHAASG